MNAETLPLRIAHLSDFHFRRALPGTSSIGARRSRDGLVEAALARLEEEPPDLLVITGDLLDVPMFLLEAVPRGFPMPGGSAAWREAALADYRYLRERLEATGIPYRVVPGNHDEPEAFAEVFGDQGWDFSFRGHRVLSLVDHEQEGGAPRRLTPSRDRFEDALADADPTPQIHLQHYLLHPVGEGGYPYHYPEHEALRREIAASGRVRLSLSGHYHAGTPLREEDGTFYSVAPALCHAPHRWRTYEIAADGAIRMEEHALGTPEPQRTVFLDRDGVINDLPSYTEGPEAMRLVPGAAAAIRALGEAGWRTVVVTSQSGIGFGYVTEAVVNLVHERMQALLAQEGAYLDAIYYSKGAGERSVLPGWEKLPTAKACLIGDAAKTLPLAMEGSWIVGDRRSDLDAGAAHGLRSILVRTGFGADEEKRLSPGQATAVVDDLAAAARLILA